MKNRTEAESIAPSVLPRVMAGAKKGAKQDNLNSESLAIYKLNLGTSKSCIACMGVVAAYWKNFHTIL